MPQFAHHRLDAYHAALDLAVRADRLTRRIPRGHRALAARLCRAATAVPLLIAEGANRFSAPQKKQRFAEARGECGEVAAVAELVGRLAWAGAEEITPVLETAHRVAALLTGLVRRCG